MARFKTFDPKFAPSRYAAADTPRGADDPLEDKKFREVSALLDEREARGRFDADEAAYLRRAIRRWRWDWPDWFEATSAQYILLGGAEEIRSRQRDGRWEDTVKEMKHADAAA